MGQIFRTDSKILIGWRGWYNRHLGHVEPAHGYQRVQSLKRHSREHHLILEKYNIMSLIKWQEIRFIFDSPYPP